MLDARQFQHTIKSLSKPLPKQNKKRKKARPFNGLPQCHRQMETFIKGYKINRHNLAKLAEIPVTDLRIYSAIDVLIRALNRDGYLFLGGAYDTDPVSGERVMEMIVVLEEQLSEEALRNESLSATPLDETVAKGVEMGLLEGPKIWERFA